MQRPGARDHYDDIEIDVFRATNRGLRHDAAQHFLIEAPVRQSRTQKITPCLCFDDQAEAAVNFYLSIFDDSKLLAVTRCGPGERGGALGGVRTIAFELFGREYLVAHRRSSVVAKGRPCPDLSEIKERRRRFGILVSCPVNKLDIKPVF